MKVCRMKALEEIKQLSVADVAAQTAHLYLWVPNALLGEGLAVTSAWGFTYKSNIVWHKIRKDGGPDGRGVGFYFRNVTELVLFGVQGKNARTLAPGRRQAVLEVGGVGSGGKIVTNARPCQALGDVMAAYAANRRGSSRRTIRCRERRNLNLDARWNFDCARVSLPHS
jgi:hypothetical protein